MPKKKGKKENKKLMFKIRNTVTKKKKNTNKEI